MPPRVDEQGQQDQLFQTLASFANRKMEKEEFHPSVIHNVAMRLQVRDAFRFMFVSKWFYKVLGHRDFKKIYRSKSESKGVVVVRSLGPQSNLSWLVCSPSQNLQEKQRTELSTVAFPVSSITGFVLFVRNMVNVFLFSPVTREKLSLPESGPTTGHLSYGFGLHGSCYKVVRLRYHENHTEVKVYSLGSFQGWRRIGMVKEKVAYRAGSTVGRYIHWLCKQKDSYDILCFNIETERFCSMRCPQVPDMYTPQLGVVNGKLCIALTGPHRLHLYIAANEDKQLIWKSIRNQRYPFKLRLPMASLFPKLGYRYNNLENHLLIENHHHMVLVNQDFFGRVCTREQSGDFRQEFIDAVSYEPTMLCMREMFRDDQGTLERFREASRI